jgi:8-oxo-dGTP pyrophosphatase MutT (NUDIX family)
MEQLRNREQGAEKEKTIEGAMTIFYRNVKGQLLFLVVENTKTGNISFVSGADEEIDEASLKKTAQREITEELGLTPDSYRLTPTDARYDFVFNSKKTERAGKKASYQVCLSDVTDLKDEIGHTTELKSAKWMTKEEVISSLTFPELKDVFEKAISAIES